MGHGRGQIGEAISEPQGRGHLPRYTRRYGGRRSKAHLVLRLRRFRQLKPGCKILSFRRRKSISRTTGRQRNHCRQAQSDACREACSLPRPCSKGKSVREGAGADYSHAQVPLRTIPLTHQIEVYHFLRSKLKLFLAGFIHGLCNSRRKTGKHNSQIIDRLTGTPN